MDKLIDNIIELILGDVDCHHDVDHDEDGIHTSVEYNLNNETKLRRMIKELIQKPEVNEASIEEKARAAWNLWWYKASGKYAADFTGTIRFDFQGVKNLIRSLVEEEWK